jgi:hypothetical protein
MTLQALPKATKAFFSQIAIRSFGSAYRQA